MTDAEIRALPLAVRDAFERIPEDAFDSSPELADTLAELDAANALHATAVDDYVGMKSTLERLDGDDVQAGLDVERLTAERTKLLPGIFLEGSGGEEAVSLLVEIQNLCQRRIDWQAARSAVDAKVQVLEKQIARAAWDVQNAGDALQKERDRLRLDEARRLDA